MLPTESRSNQLCYRSGKRGRREGHEARLKLILDAGAVQCDARDENGWTLLRTAAWSGQHRCVATLIQAEAQVMISDQ